MKESDQRAIVGAFIGKTLVGKRDVPAIPHKVYQAVRDLREKHPDAYITHRVRNRNLH